MKLTVDPDIISAAADRVKATANGRVTLPILAGMLLKAEGDTLTLTGNSLDVMIECSVPATITEPGSVVLPARRLADALSLMRGGGDVEITSDKKLMCEIKQGAKRSLKVPGMNPEEWQHMSPVDGPVSITFGEGELKEALDRVAPFMSTDETRYVLNGVFFEGGKGCLTMAATDGNAARILRRDSDFTGSAIIPSIAVDLLRSLGKGQAVNAKASENAVEFDGRDWRLSTRVIEGTFPNILQSVPTKAERNKSIKFNRDALMDAASFALLAVDEQNPVVKLASGKGSLSIQATGRDGQKTACEVDGGTGDAPLIAFKPAYLRDAVRSMGDAEQTLEIIDAMNPGVIENATGVVVIAPMRVL